jgi:hypothetical protein
MIHELQTCHSGGPGQTIVAMKKLMLITGISLFLFACKKDSVDVRNNPDRIDYQETVYFSPTGVLTFADVTDSRCPEGVQCVWAGNVVVDLDITPVQSGSKEIRKVKMCLGNCSPLYPARGFVQKDTAFITYGGVNHTLILSDVSPYPAANKTIRKEDYSIKLDIQ